MLRRSLLCISLSLAGLGASAQPAKDAVLNVYSARHYQTDEALYTNFTKQTGIKINRLDGKEDELVERIRNEGTASPADVLITVDAARLEVADNLGLFQPVKSKLLEERVPRRAAHGHLVLVLDPRPRHRAQQGGGEERLGADV